MTENDRLLRNQYSVTEKWGVPIIRKTDVDIEKIYLLACDEISSKTKLSYLAWKTIHFFKDDSKLERFYKEPEKYRNTLASCYCVFTPDFSIYDNMPLPIQLMNTFKNRWCGAYWQHL